MKLAKIVRQKKFHMILIHETVLSRLTRDCQVSIGNERLGEDWGYHEYSYLPEDEYMFDGFKGLSVTPQSSLSEEQLVAILEALTTK